MKRVVKKTKPVIVETENSVTGMGFGVKKASEALYDLLHEKTTQSFVNKRNNAGVGRGRGFWRVLHSAAWSLCSGRKPLP